MRHSFYFRYFLCLCVVLLNTYFVSGQGKAQREYSKVFDTYYFRGPISYTGSFGMASYKGDLSSKVPGTLGAVFSIGANYKLWPRTIFGAEIFHMNLASKDHRPERSIGFKSSNLEFDLYGRFLLIDDIQRRGKDKISKPGRLKPYIMTGIGFLKYKPKSYTYGASPDSLTSSNEGVRYPRWGIVIPVGVGLSVFVTHRVSVIAESNYRFTFSDYLDDVSKRADPGNKDGYISFNLKVQYTPTAQKSKKKKTHTAPTPYEGPKGTDTWKNKKKKPQEEPYEETQDQNLPQETNPENTDPNNPDPNNGDGGGKIENQIEEPVKEDNVNEIK
ncbi:MAG: hypothetical protein ACJ75J_15315 [Cytophagaceae bacterium]